MDSRAHRLSSCGTPASVVAAPRLSYPPACGILVSQPRIKPTSPALEGRVLTTGPPGILSFAFFEVLEIFSHWASPDGSVGKDSACNAGEPSSIPGSQRSPGEGIGYPLQYSWASPCGSACKESACNVGNLGSIPRLGRSPGERKGCILAWRNPWTV